MNQFPKHELNGILQKLFREIEDKPFIDGSGRFLTTLTGTIDSSSGVNIWSKHDHCECF